MIRSFNKNASAILTIYLILALNYLQLFCLIPDNGSVLYASGQPTTCVERLNQAEELYYDGEFDKTIEIVNQCLLQEFLPKNEQVRSYTILARTYLAKDDTNLTKDNIRIILKMDPSYQPTIEQEIPRYVNLVTQIKKEQQRAIAVTSTGISSWLLIGAGSVAAAAIIAIVASGGGNEKGNQDTSLPEPPDFPE